MASISLRSSRRAEGLSTRSSARNNVAAYNTNQQSNIGRKKRPRDSFDHDEYSIAISAKKAKIAIEIPKTQPKTRSLVIQRETIDAKPSAPPPAAAPKTATTQTPEPPPRKPTNHHEKFVNGIRHELDRLEPSPADLKPEKRKLRSQEGTRFKSELSACFPEYDEVIGNEPKEDRKLQVWEAF
jgi:hypothetical protein